MGCSSSVPSSSVSQPQATTPTPIPTKSPIAERQSLSDACQSGDVDRMTDLLRIATLDEINKADSNTGDTPPHLATHHDWLEIVHKVLSLDKNNPAADDASDTEIKKQFERSTNSMSNRFVGNNFQEEGQEEIEWLQSATDAMAFFIEYENDLSDVGLWNVDKTVDAIQKAPELSEDTSSDMKTVWDFLNKACQTNDPTYLVRAYTVESNFFRILNEKLAQRCLKKSEDEDRLRTVTPNSMGLMDQDITMLQAQLAGTLQTDNTQTTDWVHLFLGNIHTLLVRSDFQFHGRTYRGMRVNEQDLVHYEEEKLYMCNKTMISTSSSVEVAKHFIHQTRPSAGQVPVMCSYMIDSFVALKALNVRTISEYPEEEEVILFPGTPFEIVKVGRDIDSNMVTIELVPMSSNRDNLQHNVNEHMLE